MSINFNNFKNESSFQKIKDLALTAPRKNIAFAFIGGTGAVGGQTAIEVIQSLESIIAINQSWASSKPVLLVTGLNKEKDGDISQFIAKLHSAFKTSEGDGFATTEANGDVIILTRKSGIKIEIHSLDAKPDFISNLAELVKNKSADEIKDIVRSEVQNISSPIETFLKGYIKEKNLSAGFRFQAVVSGIPIASFAYRFDDLDMILEESGIKAKDLSKTFEREIKLEILYEIAHEFARIRKQLSNEVLIAHTSAVGGMFMMEGAKPVIRLGYAHSALDELLLEKQYFANALTEKYSALGLKVLITAAAIGIDSIFIDHPLPINNGIYKKYRAAYSPDPTHNQLPFPVQYLDKNKNVIFQPELVSPFLAAPGVEGRKEKNKLQFSDQDALPELKVAYGLRSGENGILSIDNALSLYLNMKVAVQEELSHILAFNSLFGDDAQRAWFDKDGICYQTESENAGLVFALLYNRAGFRAYQTSGFTPKAFQDLGSAKHQSELHTMGMYMLAHRLKNLNPRLVSEKIKAKYSELEAIEFVDRNTEPLSLEDIIHYDPEQTATEFTALLTMHSPEELARFTGFNAALVPTGFIYTFFQVLLNGVKHTISTITSLGTPIVFRHNGEVNIYIGPYCAAIDAVISNKETFAAYVKQGAEEYRLDYDSYFEWIVANNGFVDLRPQATITTAKTHKQGLAGNVQVTSDLKEFRAAVLEIQDENMRHAAHGYFATSGIVAFIGRIIGLLEQVNTFNISLGTLNSWRALFPANEDETHPVIPGVVEAMRMYTEGLGKITGFELLYPAFGYYSQETAAFV